MGRMPITVISFGRSEDATDFEAADVTVTGGSLSDFAGSGAAYTATFTPTLGSSTDGVISVADGVFGDGAGNLNADGADANNRVSITIDSGLPTVELTSDRTSLRTGETALISFGFSEPVSDFDLADVTVTGGALSGFAKSGKSYTAIFTPTADSMADGVILVGNGAVYDGAGNLNADAADADNKVTLAVNSANPVITAPADQSLETDPGADTAALDVSTLGVVAVDTAGDTVSLVFRIGATVLSGPYDFPLGETTVTIDATDGAGNAATQVSFTVKVNAAADPGGGTGQFHPAGQTAGYRHR
jgi:hypothetical protein